MILVDTSVWADHFGRAEPMLALLLVEDRLRQHPLVTAELAMGNLRDWLATTGSLRRLPAASCVDEHAFFAFVHDHQLHGTGIGFVDAHLLASAAHDGLRLWTRDKRLMKQAERLDLLHPG